MDMKTVMARLVVAALIATGGFQQTLAFGLKAGNGAGRVLNAEGQNLKADVKVEFGEGHGETAEEALKDAMRDVLQRVVGIYVDAEFRVNNDEVIKDQILTHSNGFIDHYRKMEEGDDPSGRGKFVTIKAWVKTRAFVSSMQKLAPSQKVQVDGVLLGTDVDNSVNAEGLLRGVFDDFSPVRDLLEVKLVNSIRPVVRSSSGDMVTMRYVYQITYSKEKYYKQFLPRVNAVLDQIAVKTTTRQVPFKFIKVAVPPSNGEGEFWNEQTVDSHYFRNMMPNRQTHSWYEKGANVVSIVQKIYSGGPASTKDWVLSDHLKNVFDSCRRNWVEHDTNITCEFTLFDGAGESLAVASRMLDYHRVIRAYGKSFGEDAVDFIPLLDFSEPVRDNLNKADEERTWEIITSGISYEAYDRYVGYIDVTIGRNDVSKIRSAEIKLGTGK